MADFVVNGISIQNGMVTGYDGAGIVVLTDGIVLLDKNNIRNNKCYDDAHGGGVSVRGASSLQLRENSINGNLADYGAGLYAFGIENIILDRNTFINNSTNRYGGGVYIQSASHVTVKENIINNNETLRRGGGIYVINGNIEIEKNSVENNFSGQLGGGIYVQQNNVTLSDNIIMGNYTSINGGGFYSSFSNINMKNNIVTNNIAEGSGGGIFFDGTSYTNLLNIINNTISFNQGNEGGGIWSKLYDDDEASIYNNILINNIANTANSIYVINDGDNNYILSLLNIYNNNFDQSAAGTYIQIPFSIDPSNLNNEDPLFVDPANDNFHLTKESHCRDAGDNDAPELPDTDIDGELRILDGFVDIGADEYSAPLCRTDFNGDKNVDVTDLDIFSFAMGEADCTWWPPLCVCDTDGDDDVDATDLAVLVAEFGRSDCP